MGFEILLFYTYNKKIIDLYPKVTVLYFLNLKYVSCIGNFLYFVYNKINRKSQHLNRFERKGKKALFTNILETFKAKSLFQKTFFN